MAAIRVYTASGGWQDIALTGPTGAQGANGTVTVYEQAAAPASPQIGQIWIDTDDSPSLGIGGPIYTSLPSSPADGQEIRFLADATNGIVWNLRYRLASSSPYKWEFIGGNPLVSGIAAQVGPSSANAYSYVPGTDAQITIPLAGEYLIEVSCSCRTSGAVAGDIIQMGWVRTTAPTSLVAGVDLTVIAANYRTAMVACNSVGAGWESALIYTAGTVLRMIYWVTSVSTVFGSRAMQATPIRVG